jgi:hypothetical protein
VPAEGRRRRLRLRRAARAAAGQTTIEMLAVLPLVLVVILGFIQMLFIGYTWMETSQAARAGARAWAVDDDKGWWTSAAKDQLPASWRDSTEVDALKDGGVRVTVQVPRALPLPDSLMHKLRIVEEKRTVAEE